jgi:hypothetical protein
MKIFRLLILAVVVIAGLSIAALAQTETYTGTILSFGSGRSTRSTTSTFTLNITGSMTDADVDRAVAVLQEGGQDDLLSSIRRNNQGNFSVGGELGRQLIGVRIDEVDGKRRIRAIFERWMKFGEIRNGYRSVDYPFGYMELLIDPATGRGEGTFLEAARIRWRRDRRSNQYFVEIEDFGTFPARLMGVRRRNR